MKTKQEFSSGGCVYKQLETDDRRPKTLWLIGKHSGYHKWILPKGMIEEGETTGEAALREVLEETGVKAKIVVDEVLYTESYSYIAQLKDESQESSQSAEPERRVSVYQENDEFDPESEENVQIEKTVSYFLMEYVSGDPGQHDWEMTDAGWFTFEEAMEKLSFEGERAALHAAHDRISS